MKTLGEIMKRPVLPVPVPEFVLKTILGEMSVVVLKGSRISDEKIISSGYSLFLVLSGRLFPRFSAVPRNRFQLLDFHHLYCLSKDSDNSFFLEI